MNSEPDKIYVFKDEAGAWRWHQIAANGERVATSGEPFDSKENAERAAGRQAAIRAIALQVEVGA